MIQEVVDAHKEDMPTGVTTRVMEECQKAYNELPALYKLTWTVVDSHARAFGGWCAAPVGAEVPRARRNTKSSPRYFGGSRECLCCK